MSATSQPQDFQDLYTDLLNRVRSQTGQNATLNQSKRYINIALQDAHIGFREQFPWAERHAVLRTQPEYNTGTVTITKGSTTLTGSGTLWNTNNEFSVANARTTGKITIAGSQEVYTISAVGSDTSITLNESFIDDDVSAETYNYFEDEYDLHADFLRPFDFRSFDQNDEIPLIGRREFRVRYPRNKTTGKPVVGTIVDRAFVGNTTPVRRIVFHQPPDKAFLIPYSFITNKLAVSSTGVAQENLSADTDEPIVPLPYRHAIVFHALGNWYRDKKDDTRSQEAFAQYTDVMLRISGDIEIGSPRPQIRPRLHAYASRSPYRRRGSRHTLGSSFDEIRS